MHRHRRQFRHATHVASTPIQSTWEWPMARLRRLCIHRADAANHTRVCRLPRYRVLLPYRWPWTPPVAPGSRLPFGADRSAAATLHSGRTVPRNKPSDSVCLYAGVDRDVVARLAACRQRRRVADVIDTRIERAIEDGGADAHRAQRCGIGWRRRLPGLRPQSGLLLQPGVYVGNGRGAGRIVAHDAHVHMSAHAALQTDRPAAATMIVRLQTIIVALHAVSAWQRLACRSTVPGSLPICSHAHGRLSTTAQRGASMHRRQRNPQSGERPVPSARRNSVLAGRLTCCRTPFAHCRKHTLAVGRAAVACSVVVWPGLNLGR
ncbi:hypothetical protein CKU38_00135 [Xanthomonas citri pv. fuscans]|nr:hypothetical protein CKU38_00135 [Xanthomonas citri pv. fuscans]